MNRAIYTLCRHAIRFIRMQCLDTRTLHLDRLNRDDTFLIACTHISHLEPMLLSSMIDKPIRWIARTEYYRPFLANRLLDLSGAIPIQRTGQPPVKAIRSSIQYLKQGDLVGIFPEGGLMRRDGAIIRGGVNKSGAAVIAMRANVPIIPVVMLGTEKLNAVEPWLPGKCYKLWIGVGNAVWPTHAGRRNRRQHRIALTQQIGAEFIETYQQMLAAFNLRDDQIP